MTMTRAELGVTRRAMLAGMAAGAVVGAGRARAAGAEAIDAILARSGLGAVTGFAVAEAGGGAVAEGHQADLDRPPASVAKVVTALYALDRLGPGHVFETRIAAAGPIESRTLTGDVALVGGGDPLLDTDALGDLLAEAREAGLGAARGRLVVAAGALPALAEIEPDQPQDAGYNPAISGMNLNFNRVFLEWEPGGAGPVLRLSAPGARFRAQAPSIAAELGAAGGRPSHRLEEGREVWALAPASLKGRGGVWLPVRAPAVYAGEALRGLAAEAGLALPAPVVVAEAPVGITLAARASAPLGPMMRDMLRYSTNLTAEVAGLSAARADGGAAEDLAASASAMTDWARARYGLGHARLVNHSGLTARSAMTAGEMVRLLTAAQGEGLAGMLRERPLRDVRGDLAPIQGVRVLAKTGTLNFVSALAGYVEGPGPRRLAFAIFAADLGARERIRPEERADPPGARAWARRARAQEQALLRRWIALAG